MVKSYDRYQQEKRFGVITSQANIVWLPPGESQTKKSVGRALTSAVEDLLVWDIKTGEILQVLSDSVVPGSYEASTSVAPSAVSYISYNESSNIVASGYNDGTIKIWDLASSSVIIKFQGHKSRISKLVFDKTGTRLISGLNDSTMVLWDLIAEEGLFKLKGHKSEITDLRFVSKTSVIDQLDDYLLSVSKDGLIKLWELDSKQCIETHIAHSNECWSMGINDDGTILITSGNKDQVKIWAIDLTKPDTEKLIEKGIFEKQSKNRCVDIKFEKIIKSDQVNELFYLQNNDRLIEVFRIRNWHEMQKGIKSRTKRLKEKGLDDDEIITNIRQNQVSMMITPFTTLRTLSKIKSCDWTKVGNDINLILGMVNNSLEVHNLKLPENFKKSNDIVTQKVNIIDNLGHRHDIRAIDISSNNDMLVTTSNGELKVWNIKNYNILRSFQLSSGYPLCTKFLPGGSLVVVGFKNGDLELYDLSKSTLVDRVERAHHVNEEGCSIWSLDITPDGKTLVTGGNDKCIKFWDFQIDEELVPGTTNYIPKLKLHHKQTIEMSDDVLCVRISPNGKLLAISLLNNNVQVVYIDSCKIFLTLYGHKLPVLSIDISADSKLIITSSADKNIKIWGLDFGDCHKSIFGHDDSIMNVRFIADTHHFFSSGKDGLIKYWDGDKFECIQKLVAHQLEVWSLCVSSNGVFMVSASHDHSIRVWSASNDQVFLEEERERELDELYQDNLIQDDEDISPDNDQAEVSDEVTKVSKQNMESLKAGEKLLEALDIGYEDLVKTETYHQLLAANKPATKPEPNAILKVYNIRGDQYVFKVINEIKQSQLEDALLVLPFLYSLRLLKFIDIWSGQPEYQTLTIISQITKIINFIIKFNLKELINQKDPQLKTQLIGIKSQFRAKLLHYNQQMAFNSQGLKFIKQQWDLNHSKQFIDQDEQDQYQKSKATKRTFMTL